MRPAEETAPDWGQPPVCGTGSIIRDGSVQNIRRRASWNYGTLLHDTVTFTQRSSCGTGSSVPPSRIGRFVITAAGDVIMLLARRALLHTLGAAALLPMSGGQTRASPTLMPKVRPGDAGWPSPARWEELNRAVGGRLTKVKPLLAACNPGTETAACKDVLKDLRNPYFLDEQPAGTESSGWIDAWQSAPSAYAVSAHSTADVVAAVNFARTHRVRLGS